MRAVRFDQEFEKQTYGRVLSVQFWLIQANESLIINDATMNRVILPSPSIAVCRSANLSTSHTSLRPGARLFATTHYYKHSRHHTFLSYAVRMLACAHSHLSGTHRSYSHFLAFAQNRLQQPMLSQHKPTKMMT